MILKVRLGVFCNYNHLDGNEILGRPRLRWADDMKKITGKGPKIRVNRMEYHTRKVASAQ